MAGTPFKMNGFSGFGNSPLHGGKAKHSQTKTNIKTGKTTIIKNPGSGKIIGGDASQEDIQKFFKNIKTGTGTKPFESGVYYGPKVPSATDPAHGNM